MPTYIMLSKSERAGGFRRCARTPSASRRSTGTSRSSASRSSALAPRNFVLGPHDFVNIVEAPDAKTIARVSLRHLGARGSCRILQTYEAIGVDELIDLAIING